jgi:CBS domain-containing protein
MEMNSVQRESATIRVRDVMSRNLVTARDTDRASTAVTLLLKYGVGSVLVVDKKAQLVGIITKGDVLREIVTKHLDPDVVESKEIMSKPVITIDEDCSLEDASDMMIQKKVSKLAVMKEGQLGGIITSTDIIRVEPIQVSYLEELVRARFVPKDLRY